MDKNTFFAEFKLSEEDLTEANISWDELMLIEEAYSKIERSLREIGKSFIDEYLYDIETAGIHSYRYRTKGAAQLLEKVIRKRKENPEKFAQLDHTNYYKFVTDLIGIRVFFLYREDWKYFHQYFGWHRQPSFHFPRLPSRNSCSTRFIKWCFGIPSPLWLGNNQQSW